MPREEHAVVLDFLPHGYPFDKRPLHLKNPIAQTLGKDSLVLLELVPKKDVFLQPLEGVYVGEGKRDKIHHIEGRISYDKLTETAKKELEFVIIDIVQEREKKFVDFFNKAGPMSMRVHQLQLLPGVGKKHLESILEARREKDFESFHDLKERVKLIPQPDKLIIKRILNELQGIEKHFLFVRP